MTLTRPLIAVTLGDPGGVGPELAVRLAKRPESHEHADLVLVGDRSVIAMGEKAAGISLSLQPFNPLLRGLHGGKVLHLQTDTIAPEDIATGEQSRAGGLTAVRMLGSALELVQGGDVAGLLMMPVSEPLPKEDDLPGGSVAGVIGSFLGLGEPACEIAAMSSLWVTSVTGPAPFAEVPRLLSEDAIFKVCKVVHGALRSAGLQTPRIALTGLNPTITDAAGEERAMVIPAIARVREEGIDCEGPFTAEAIFRHALDSGVDAVIAMYHDQARIATSLMGFERGLTFYAGLPAPVMAPAHDPKFELAGKGKVEFEPSLAALNMMLTIAVERGPAFRFRGDTGRERKR
ncbi:MAG: 4-hydroxythreonine-4-phosphate dehydrogenase PdxA [Geminicoccaceae bacterium]|nr:4-hydroxythreonine-4-phosphate dehydrogenase PdxA [Geminicoccaceae bacterium]MCB9945199.1 4-hydroxythreonine-4-phosphate dehydrogenase PdxA [Geminicoccaceae bacterium]